MHVEPTGVPSGTLILIVFEALIFSFKPLESCQKLSLPLANPLHEMVPPIEDAFAEKEIVYL